MLGQAIVGLLSDDYLMLISHINLLRLSYRHQCQTTDYSRVFLHPQSLYC